MKKEAVKSIALAFCLLAFMAGGCAPTIPTINVLTSYSGPELIYDQALLLTDPESTISFLSIDGEEKTDTGIPFKIASRIWLLPGVHNVLVEFKYRDYVSLYKKIVEWKSTEPQLVSVDVEAGHAYQMYPGVKLLDVSDEIYIWEPFLDDITYNYPDFYCEVPKQRVVRTLKSRLPHTTYSIDLPNSDGWVMNITKPSNEESRSLLPLLFTKGPLGHLPTTGIYHIFVNIYEWDATIDPPSFDASGFKAFLSKTVPLKATMLSIENYKVDSISIGTRDWQRYKYRMYFFMQEHDLYSSTENITFITECHTGGSSDYIIIGLSFSKYGLSDESIQLPENDIKVITEMAESFQCTIVTE